MFDLGGLAVILILNGAAAALVTRFFRIRLGTRWGPLVYALTLAPLLLVGLTMLVGSALGPNLGSPATVVGLTVVLPLAAGVAFDYFWMPAPDEVDLPAEYQQ